MESSGLHLAYHLIPIQADMGLEILVCSSRVVAASIVVDYYEPTARLQRDSDGSQHGDWIVQVVIGIYEQRHVISPLFHIWVLFRTEHRLYVLPSSGVYLTFGDTQK